MILGIGNDLTDIRRIEKSLERFGDRFVQRIFTETEQKRSEGRATRAASYAKRFAAKEACAKALGTGLRRGVFWRDMGVIKLDRRISHGAGDRDHFCRTPFMSEICVKGVPAFCSAPMPRRQRETAALGPAIGAACLNWYGDDGRG